MINAVVTKIPDNLVQLARVETDLGVFRGDCQSELLQLQPSGLAEFILEIFKPGFQLNGFR